LGVVIPEDKKRFETQMRALKKGGKKQIQIPETRYIPNIDAALANIDKNIKQITADSVARNIILNKKNIFLTTYHDVKNYVYNTIRKSVLISNFNDNSNLINDMDLSEMDCLYIIMECEKHFQITIPNQEIRNIKTVRDITDAVCKVRGIKTPAQIAQEQFDAMKQTIANTNSQIITK
jgi:acyl carrier protein